MTSTLDPHVAVVTGAAGGIGAAVVRRLRERGMCVAALDVDGPGLGRALGAEAPELHFFEVDVRDAPALVSIADDLAAGLGRIDLLVTCAGVFRRTPALEPDGGAIRLLLETNLESAIHATRAFGRHMQRRGGRIVHVGSVAAVTGAALAAGYAASKAGLVAVTRSHARELAAAGIAVNAVLPGYCRTSMLEAELGLLKHTVLPRIPLHRVAEPEEIAEVVELVGTCKTPYLTGSTVVVDGGLHVG